MEWTREKTAFLIAMFRTKHELWDPTDLGYKDRAKKHEAWAELGARMGMESHEVEKKLRMLMGQFFRELKKGKIGEAPDSPYKSKWVFFNMLIFLKDKKSLRLSHDGSYQQTTCDHEVTQSEDTILESAYNSYNESDQETEEQKYSPYEYNNLSTIPSPTVPKCAKRKADTSANEMFTVTKNISTNLQTRDEFDAFGEYVAHSLRNLKTRSSQCHTKFQISNILYQSEMEYQHNEVLK